jgi:plastocyanin
VGLRADAVAGDAADGHDIDVIAAASGTLRTGATFSVKVTQKGAIHYYCSIHPWMRGTIVVSP